MQYMPMKPTKRGIKVWCLADSNNRYIQAFDVYSGKGGHTDPAEDADVSGLGAKVVMLLTCTFKERTIICDNNVSCNDCMNSLIIFLTMLPKWRCRCSE